MPNLGADFGEKLIATAVEGRQATARRTTMWRSLSSDVTGHCSVLDQSHGCCLELVSQAAARAELKCSTGERDDRYYVSSGVALLLPPHTLLEHPLVQCYNM